MQRIKKGDTVQVISGKDKGRRGKVLQVSLQDDRIMVEGINIVKRHMKPTQQSRGGIVDKTLALRGAKLMPVCPHCNKPTRVFATEDSVDVRRRQCGECEKVLDNK